MKVSVIIPTYNEEAVILDCLESLGNQSYSDFEIIIVDDGSQDKTPSLVENAAKIVKNLKLIKQNHKGAGAARNLGVKQAKGEIVIFLDADMTFADNFIEKLITPIIKGDAIGTFSKEEYLENKNNVLAVCWNLNRGLPKDRMHSKAYPDYQKVFRAVLKKEFDRVGGFNDKAGYTDDYTLSEKLHVLAINAPDAVFYHKNPETLTEIFLQSKWMAKRKYKLGFLGTLIALVRVSLPISIIIGLYRVLRYLIPQFLVFKIVSDMGAFLGIMEYTLKGNSAK